MELYDDLPDGVLVAGPGGLVLRLNTAGARLLGIGAAEAIGRSFGDVLPLVDSAGRDWWACTDPYAGLAIRTGQPERLLEVGKGPAEGCQLLVASRFRRAGGRVVRLVVSFRGAASRERAAREQAELISTVAHEIRSPLTGVKGFTATLLARWDQVSDEQKRIMLTAINSDADRVTRLLSDLLDVSRIDARRLVLRRQVVNLPEVVARVIAGLVAAGETEERFVLSSTAPLPEMWLDQDKVAQMVGNLVDNALRHGAGRICVDVAPVTVPEAGRGARLTVCDEGPGIGLEARARIFTRFWRAGGAGNGTGLGLYIVRGLVEAHGGTIEVDDPPAGGARFTVFLPAGRPPYEV